MTGGDKKSFGARFNGQIRKFKANIPKDSSDESERGGGSYFPVERESDEFRDESCAETSDDQRSRFKKRNKAKKDLRKRNYARYSNYRKKNKNKVKHSYLIDSRKAAYKKKCMIYSEKKI